MPRWGTRSPAHERRRRAPKVEPPSSSRLRPRRRSHFRHHVADGCAVVLTGHHGEAEPRHGAPAGSLDSQSHCRASSSSARVSQPATWRRIAMSRNQRRQVVQTGRGRKTAADAICGTHKMIVTFVHPALSRQLVAGAGGEADTDSVAMVDGMT